MLYVHIKNIQEEPADPGSIDNIIELYQSDFEEGTYRIRKSGTYIIMEDIEFDFNAGDLNDPNTEWAWWPREDQSKEYPGAYKTRDEYFMGFFAGITIECDGVILDLNDHEIRMSKAFMNRSRIMKNSRKVRLVHKAVLSCNKDWGTLSK